MNILAHLYLSGKDEEIIVGNFIGDFVKGNQIRKYAENISTGVRLHREIDHFTDGHPLVKKTNNYFRSKYGKHSGIVTDIIFDHYLSNNWSKFSTDKFNFFIQSMYKILNRNLKKFPFGVIEFYPIMIINNWLNLYSTLPGLERVLKGMSNRTSLPAEYKYAISQIKTHYYEIDEIFVDFFYQIIDHVSTKFNIQIDLPGKEK